MYFPSYRPRRLRRNATLRRMVRENHLRVDDLIYPMFSAFGENIKKEFASHFNPGRSPSAGEPQGHRGEWCGGQCAFVPDSAGRRSHRA